MLGREMGTSLLHSGEYRYVHLGLSVDPNATAIKARYDGKFIALQAQGQEVCFDVAFGKMIGRNQVNAVKHQSRGGKEDVSARRWTLNSDGTMSPTDGQHLALGDLVSSGLDPEIWHVPTAAVAMTEVVKGEEGTESVPVAARHV